MFIPFIILAIPIAALTYFIDSLMMYFKRDKSDAEQCGKRKKSLIISSVLFVTITVAWTVLMIIAASELSHM